jgi:SAM-dependent methyltransferase
MHDIRYDAIGREYARFRREDPRFRARILAALGDARTVVNVGAGAGSHEPSDRHVVAIEPSDVMAAQRPRDLAPAIRAGAAELPLRDGSVDAAMAILTLHHWDDAREQGVRELRRVARGPVVVFTFDPRVSGTMWLMAEYLPEVAALDRTIFPRPGPVRSFLIGARPFRWRTRSLRKGARPFRWRTRSLRNGARPFRWRTRALRKGARPLRWRTRSLRKGARPFRWRTRSLRKGARPLRWRTRSLRKGARSFLSLSQPPCWSAGS